MSDRDRVRTTYNVYGPRKKAICEEAIAAAKAHPVVDSTSEAVAEMARGYLAHVWERADGHESVGVGVPPEAVTVANALLTAAGDEEVTGGADALVEVSRSYTGWDAREAVERAEAGGDAEGGHEAMDGGGLHEERHEENGAEGGEVEEEAETEAPPSATDGGQPIETGTRGSSSAVDQGGHECQQCGSAVTERYVRVFARDGEGVRVCPKCPDTIRGRDGRPRAARATRHNTEGGTPDFSRSEATKD